MIKIKNIISLIILLILNFEAFSKEQVYIVYKIDNKIITNIDVENEYRYLIALSPQLKNLDRNKILKISKESALREKIKKITLSNYFDIESIDLNINNYLINFYKTLDIKDDDEFKGYLKNNNLALKYVEEKIKIEVLWNQLIYDKYKNQINIDKVKLKKKLKQILSNKDDKKIYFLSEILFEKENNSSFEKKSKNINQSINEIGFNNTAHIYSISDSSKFGGKIGWIEEQKLSKKITEKLQLLKSGQHTIPIQTGNAFLILKIEEIKYEKNIIDQEKELDKMIQFETSKQLDQFSKIFYKKIKINNVIDEL
jgi:peptidyl-prolyl cis-trans isomerase SurA